MSGVLSSAQIIEIRKAMRIATDTFFKTPIIWKSAQESMDEYNEDREDTIYDNYLLEALVEYPKEKIVQSLDGATYMHDITVSFNMDYLVEQGLVNTEDLAIFDATKDYFKVNGEMYKVTLVTYDGPLEKLNVLCIAHGKKDVKGV